MSSRPTQDNSPAPLALLSVAGPVSAYLALQPPGPLAVGRRPNHALCLPDPASRDHAQLVFDPRTSQWYIIDTDSKHGTRLNGVRLEPQRKYPIQVGDLVEIQPFTLEVIDPAARRGDQSIVHTVDDGPTAGTTIAPVQAAARSQSEQLLELLLQCAERIHAAKDETALAEATLEAAVLGTGFRNAALLRPLAADGSISVVGYRGAVDAGSAGPQLSRSLIRQASAGRPARLSRQDSHAMQAASIVSLGIDEALCVPIIFEKTLAGYLYLDSRSSDASPAQQVGADTAEFVVGIARLAAMAMANLKRLELLKRMASIQNDLAAAAEAQRWVLPPRVGAFGRLSYMGESRPGRIISGDFFDVMNLDEHRLAVSLGDVTGKGVAASVLMTATQGFLHAALSQHGDVARAVAGLNSFIQPRCSDAHFVTLWCGMIDLADGTLTYVDAGHGYALLHKADGSMRTLNEAGGPPIGIVDQAQHTHAQVAISQGDQLMIVSDGLVEQPGGDRAAGQFGLEAVGRLLAGCDGRSDAVAAVFDAVTAHAGSGDLADDATAVLIRLAGG